MGRPFRALATGPSRWALLVGVFLPVGLAARAAATHTVSWLAVGEATLTLNVPVDIAGADPARVDRWEEAIALAWNRGNDGRPFSVCGRQVRVKPRFSLRAAAQPSPHAHLVIVRAVGAGQPFVSSVRHALGTSPSYSPRTGVWSHTIDAATAAHEFGHLLGLPDEYVENDANDNGVREPGEDPTPDVVRYPDAWFSLMARDGGSVLPRHIREIVRIHGGDDALTCEP